MGAGVNKKILKGMKRSPQTEPQRAIAVKIQEHGCFALINHDRQSQPQKIKTKETDPWTVTGDRAGYFSAAYRCHPRRFTIASPVGSALPFLWIW
ncbi:MAG: hypothetical protein AAF685_17960 [Cyanobacteria bacterium P01_C01_bin.89]